MNLEIKTSYERANEAEQAAHEQAWIKVKDRHPPAHKKYLVRRDGCIHTATPCYGMHAPWWVQRSMNQTTFEHEPVAMLDDDEWRSMP